MKLAEKLDEQKKQNRAYVEVRPFSETSFSCLECPIHPLLPCPSITKTRDRHPGVSDVQQFKAQERESQRYKSKKREKAYLKAIPILPVSSTRHIARGMKADDQPTPAQIISTPIQPPTQARPEVLAPTPQIPRPSERERDFQLFSAGSLATDFTEDLQALADLTGRPLLNRKDDEMKARAVERERDQNRLNHQLDFDFDNQTIPSPKLKISPGGSMEDLEKQIRGMTTKKPDPYVCPLTSATLS